MAGGKRDRQVTYSEEAAERKEEDYKSAPWPFVPFALVAVLFTKVIAGWHAHNGGIQLKEDVSPGEVKARGVKLNDDEFERLKHAAQLIRGNSNLTSFARWIADFGPDGMVFWVADALKAAYAAGAPCTPRSAELA